MPRKPRALIVIRLSRQVEESTSAERQLEECQRLCQLQGWEVAGVAEDLNVSAGATTPFDRPELSKWIGDGRDNPGRSREIDVLVFWRLDRLVRSMVQLSDMMKWADENNVLLKSVTEPHFDTTSTVGRLIATLVASFAEMELNAIRERITADQRHRIRAGNFRGAIPPWGYRPADDPERGRVIVPDPEQVRQIQAAAEQVLAGVPTQRIADGFNDAGELTPRDRQHVLRGRSPKGYKWQGGRLKSLLTSKTLLGMILTSDPVLDANGNPKRDSRGEGIYGTPYVVTNPDGTPKLRAEPVISREVYERVSGELRDRENQAHVTVRSNSLLLGVLHCGYCGAVAYRLRGGKGRKLQYRCRTKQDRGHCENPAGTIELEWIDDQVETFILGMMEGSRRRIRAWDSGEDHSGETIELEAQLEELIPLLGTGVYRAGTRQFDLLQERVAGISDRLEHLEELESRPGAWTWTETEELFSDWWEAATIPERNQWLQSAGFRVEYRHSPDRKRGDYPSVNFIVEDAAAFGAEYSTSPTMQNAREALEIVPAGHTAEYRNGRWELIKRV